MAEITGLVLGAIPLAIWALEKYAEPIEAYHRYRVSIECFRTDLILQNEQLRITLSNVGLTGERTRGELQEFFEMSFPNISREALSIIHRMDSAMVDLIKRLDIDIEINPSTFRAKAQWEWRRVKHSFTLKKCSKIVNDLRHWNDDLRRALERPEVPAEDSTSRVQHLTQRFNAQHCDSIRQSMSSLHRSLQSKISCSCSPPHQAAVGLDWSSYEGHSYPPIKLAISFSSTHHIQTPQISPSWRCFLASCLRPTAVPSRDSVSLQSFGTDSTRPCSPVNTFRLRFKSHPTLSNLSLRKISSPISSPRATSITSSEPTIPHVMPEISNLCDAVCLVSSPWMMEGVVKDPDATEERQFSLGHSPFEYKIVKAVSLKSLVSIKEQSRYQALSAKQRYGLAASTAWSVLHLSGSSWLGKEWDEEQLQIFIEQGPGDTELLAKHPIASYKFNTLTNPSLKAAACNNNLNHFIPNREVFALGVLLIELCIKQSFWEMRHAVQSPDNFAPGSSLDDYNTAILKLDEVRREAGDSYGDAVERCIKFCFSGRDMYKNFDFSQFRRQFYETVVAPVQATHLMYPD